MVQYLITGGAGFFGGSLAGVLQAGEDKVILAIRGRYSDGCLQNWVGYDPCSRSTVSSIIKARLDGAFHLEWPITPGSHESDSAYDVQINLAGALTLFQDPSRNEPTPVRLASSCRNVYGIVKRLHIRKVTFLDRSSTRCVRH